MQETVELVSTGKYKLSNLWIEVCHCFSSSASLARSNEHLFYCWFIPTTASDTMLSQPDPDITVTSDIELGNETLRPCHGNHHC